MPNIAFCILAWRISKVLPFFEPRNNPISCIKGCMDEFPAHFHSEVELFCVTSGMSEIEVSGKRKKLFSGDIAIIFPNKIHEYFGHTTNDHITLIFDPLMCPDFFSVFANSYVKNPFVEHRDQSPQLKEALKNLLEVLKKDSDASVVLIKGHLTVLLYYLLGSVSTEESYFVRDPDIVAQVINHVSLHYLEPISLDSISVALGYSKYEISRVFSKKLGVHFNEYLNSRRTEHAVSLLKNTSKPITEIAFSSGFESLRTFYRVFSNKYHISPMRYRIHSSNQNVKL